MTSNHGGGVIGGEIIEKESWREEASGRHLGGIWRHLESPGRHLEASVQHLGGIHLRFSPLVWLDIFRKYIQI